MKMNYDAEEERAIQIREFFKEDDSAAFWRKMFEMEKFQFDKFRIVVQEVVDNGNVEDNIESLRKALEDSE